MAESCPADGVHLKRQTIHHRDIINVPMSAARLENGTWGVESHTSLFEWDESVWVAVDNETMQNAAHNILSLYAQGLAKATEYIGASFEMGKMVFVAEQFGRGWVMGNGTGNRIWYNLTQGGNEFKLGASAAKAEVAGLEFGGKALGGLSLAYSGYEFGSALTGKSTSEKYLAGGDFVASAASIAGPVGFGFFAGYQIGKYVVVPLTIHKSER